MLTRHLDSQLQLMIISYVITVLSCAFSLCYLMVKSEHSPLRTSFATVQTVTVVWLSFAMRENVSLTLDTLLINMRVSLVCVNFTAPLWLITILFYTERLSRKNYWLIPAILAVPFTLSAPMLFPMSSSIFKLYIQDIGLDAGARTYYLAWGPFEKMTTIIALCCTVAIFCLLLDYFIKNKSMKLIEKTAVLLILWLPIVVHYFGAFIEMPFDVVPLSFSLWGAITIYLSFYRQFFNAIPSQVWNIFNVAKESMAVIGVDGSVNVNRSFMAIFGARDKDILDFADGLSPGLSEHIIQKREINCGEAEKDGVYYEVSIKNLFGKRNKVIGQLMTISDVSGTRQLTLAGERARIASGLHDCMGNRLIASINYLNLALIQPEQQAAKQYIDSAITSTVASLMTLRKIVEGLSPVNFNVTRLTTLIESVINRISASGVCADLQITGEIEMLPANLKEFIYNACQEALTNSVIHGKAENIIIKLASFAGMLRLDIVDNGRGCEVVSKNTGLATMESRACALGGKIRFGSPSSGGFGIYAEIPIKAGGQA